MTSKLVAVSDKAASIAMLEEGVREPKIKVILNGITIPEIKTSQKTDLVRKELKVSEDHVLILSVGRLVEQKGYQYLIKAARNILDRHNNACFAIAGDGELRGSLEDQVNHFKLSHAVEFLGVRDDVPDLLTAADIYLTTSLWEGLSLALLEAMGAGLPVVTTAVEGVSNVIENDINGLVVPVKDVDAIGNAVSRLIINPNLRHSLGEQANKTIRKNHSTTTMCLEYENLFYLIFRS
jgi:glycosyltransferase involved in cell wall biosynthesis